MSCLCLNSGLCLNGVLWGCPRCDAAAIALASHAVRALLRRTSSYTGDTRAFAKDGSADESSKYQVWENGQAGETQYISSTVEKK